MSQQDQHTSQYLHPPVGHTKFDDFAEISEVGAQNSTQTGATQTATIDVVDVDRLNRALERWELADRRLGDALAGVTFGEEVMETIRQAGRDEGWQAGYEACAAKVRSIINTANDGPGGCACAFGEYLEQIEAAVVQTHAHPPTPQSALHVHVDMSTASCRDPSPQESGSDIEALAERVKASDACVLLLSQEDDGPRIDTPQYLAHNVMVTLTREALDMLTGTPQGGMTVVDSDLHAVGADTPAPLMRVLDVLTEGVGLLLDGIGWDGHYTVGTSGDHNDSYFREAMRAGLAYLRGQQITRDVLNTPAHPDAADAYGLPPSLTTRSTGRAVRDDMLVTRDLERRMLGWCATVLGITVGQAVARGLDSLLAEIADYVPIRAGAQSTVIR